MIDLTQCFRAGDTELTHEVPDVELVGAARLSALLLGQPDFFFRDGGESIMPGT